MVPDRCSTPAEVAPAKFGEFWRAEERRQRGPSRWQKQNDRLHRLRTRKLMEDGEAVAVWQTYVDSHDGNFDAALGELVAALVDADLLPEGTVVRWPA